MDVQTMSCDGLMFVQDAVDARHLLACPLFSCGVQDFVDLINKSIAGCTSAQEEVWKIDYRGKGADAIAVRVI